MKIFTDTLHKVAYSTDASVYREMPLGVAYPETVEDIRNLLNVAHRRGTCLIPRAGGTSIAGQVVGKGIVVDISRNFNHILEINAEERWVRVEPGVVRDELNIALKPYGLFFSPETSTSNRCCIGGMVGNNSCGAHSLVYGSTRDHVLQLKGVLSNGEIFNTAVRGEGRLENSIYALLESWRDDPKARAVIAENFPDKSVTRRNCGYAIDEALENLDLCKLLCGSEGTLAFITEIKLSLDPLPPKEKMVLCVHLDTLEASFKANMVALKYHPTAVELMDGHILELAKSNPEASRNRFFVKGDPGALLVAEFVGADMDIAADALERELKASGLSDVCTRVYGDDVARVWNLRKAGLGILNGMKGDAKPVGVVEDTAVPVERIEEYMADFRALLKHLRLECAVFGHIGTGELHLRPIINLKTSRGLARFWLVAEETAQLVRKYHGSLSGEHGDGRLRGEFIPLVYGQECYEMMRRVKEVCDPAGVFNKGKIIDTPGMDEWLRFSVDQKYAVENAQTAYNWRAAFDECDVEGASGVRSQAHALMCSIEQCNGAAECRKSAEIGGKMCPTYKLTRNELDSPRARANVLREFLTNGQGFDSPEVLHIISTCLACKACLAECPSNVDISRIRSEILYQNYKAHGMPLSIRAIAHISSIQKLGLLVRPVYNYFVSSAFFSWFIKKFLKFSTKRSLPKLSSFSFRVMLQQYLVLHPVKDAADRRRVFIFADEFTNYQDAELGMTFAKLLIRLGYRVEIPKHFDSGRAAISKGSLAQARKLATKNVNFLFGIVNENNPLVGIEPSCILTFRDEYPDLVASGIRFDAKVLARNCLLYDEFLLREIKEGRLKSDMFKPGELDIWLHGHCHQKALVGIEKTAEVLRIIPGANVHVIPSTCCGMAGSFGYEKEHYQTSLAMGEMVLFPAVRSAVKSSTAAVPAVVAAPGISCRQQIMDGTGVRAVHPVEILYSWLK